MRIQHGQNLHWSFVTRGATPSKYCLLSLIAMSSNQNEATSVDTKTPTLVLIVLQSGVNGLLDVARQTYKEVNDDVLQLIQELTSTILIPITLWAPQLTGAEEHSLSLELKFENGRGYYLRLSALELEDRELPSLFIKDRKSTRLNSSHITPSRMPSSA